MELERRTDEIERERKREKEKERKEKRGRERGREKRERERDGCMEEAHKSEATSSLYLDQNLFLASFTAERQGSFKTG
jgi:hypothetical protein